MHTHHQWKTSPHLWVPEYCRAPHCGGVACVRIQRTTPADNSLPHPPFSPLRQVFRVILLCCDSIVASSTYGFPILSRAPVSPAEESGGRTHACMCTFGGRRRAACTDAYFVYRHVRKNSHIHRWKYPRYTERGREDRRGCMQIHRVLSIKYSTQGDHVLSPTPCTPYVYLLLLGIRILLAKRIPSSPGIFSSLVIQEAST